MNPEVAEKVRKILALAGNNSSEAEIAVAMQKARAILAAHGLTAEEFSAKQTDAETVEADEPMTNEGIAVVRSTDAWAYTLARAVGVLTNTEPLYWASRQGGKQIVMAGSATDILVARELFAYLYDRAQALSVDAMRSECPSWYGRGNKTVWRRTFLQGFADRVKARAAEGRKQEQVEAQQEQTQATSTAANLPAVRWNAIVQRKETALATYREQIRKEKNIRAGRSSQSRDAGGYSTGYAAGASVGLVSRRLVTS
jgi:hypothetical protein